MVDRMTLHDIIQSIYPAADPMYDYRIQDDGGGPYLAAWYIAGPIPTGVTMANNALAEFARLNAAAQETAKTFLRQIDELQDLIDANPQVEAAAVATEAGGIVAGSMLVKEQIQTAVALVASVRSYADSELAAGLKVRHAVYRLG
jgi:hypothetical protein